MPGLGQRVARDRLHRRAGHRERGADQHREHGPRDALADRGPADGVAAPVPNRAPTIVVEADLPGTERERHAEQHDHDGDAGEQPPARRPDAAADVRLATVGRSPGGWSPAASSAK